MNNLQKCYFRIMYEVVKLQGVNVWLDLCLVKYFTRNLQWNGLDVPLVTLYLKKYISDFFEG